MSLNQRWRYQMNDCGDDPPDGVPDRGTEAHQLHRVTDQLEILLVVDAVDFGHVSLRKRKQMQILISLFHEYSYTCTHVYLR
jgi:hypothetical protein